MRTFYKNNLARVSRSTMCLQPKLDTINLKKRLKKVLYAFIDAIYGSVQTQRNRSRLFAPSQNSLSMLQALYFRLNTKDVPTYLSSKLY